MKKVSMTKAIRQYCGLNLAAAKSRTDAVLDGRSVIVVVADAEDAESLKDELTSLGAIAEVEI